MAILRELAAVGRRGPCTDAERRAARLLARHVRSLGRRPRTETHWVRPGWPSVWLVVTLGGIAGSVASVGAPVVGLAISGATALIAVAELAGRFPVLSLLWPRRATQNVVAPSPDQAPPVRLVVTAAYDAARATPETARWLAAVDARVRRALGGRWPPPLGLLTVALLAIVVCAGLRLADIDGQWLGAVQLVPTVICIGAAALLTDLALARTTPGAGVNASAAAAAVALVAALDEAPPRRLSVELVLAGAGEARSAGMRAYVRERRGTIRAEEVAVLHVEPCAAGTPRFWTHDGPLIGARLHPEMAARAAEAGGVPHRGRGMTGALHARRVGWPAIAIGCLDDGGRVPHAGTSDDDPAHASRRSLDATVDLGLELVRRLDADLARRSAARPPAAAVSA